MSTQHTNEPMLDVYIFETTQNIEQLEQLILSSEQESCFSPLSINEIFRVMHTVKGSSAMMLFNNISAVAHAVEDLFYFLREHQPQSIDCVTLSDLVFAGVDFIKVELEKVRNGRSPDGEVSDLVQNISGFLKVLQESNFPEARSPIQPAAVKTQQYYISQDKTSSLPSKNAFKATVFFEDGCEMENIRAYTIIQHLNDVSKELFHLPEDIIDDSSIKVIKQQGLILYLKTDNNRDEIYNLLAHEAFVEDFELLQLDNDQELAHFCTQQVSETPEAFVKFPPLTEQVEKKPTEPAGSPAVSYQTIISVSVAKLDKLMDLVGELVIAETMVTHNPDLEGLGLDNFAKAASQLRKISGELQDMVMSVRMVPLSLTFQKMLRIVRDMSKKLGKDVQLQIAGDETEVDKNIIEHISDPLMHLVRNAIDHGIETNQERQAKGKSIPATVTLEAQNAGSEVLIVVRDDGKGLNKEKILQTARKNGLLYKPEDEMTEKEIYNLISVPGFSTKENVTEFSGRGVGMDVVVSKIESMGGSMSVESIADQGTAFCIKIPLTLAIIDGMNIQVGRARYTLPTLAIKECFQPKDSDIIIDPAGNEMIMVRGDCFPIIRLHTLYNVPTQIVDFPAGILIMIEQDEKVACLFADKLLGQQQVVVKALPDYIQNIKNIKGLAGCTLLGDGCISLILDVAGLINLRNGR